MEDGSNIKKAQKVFKLDLNQFKKKYYLQPPQYINKIPASFLEL